VVILLLLKQQGGDLMIGVVRTCLPIAAATACAIRTFLYRYMLSSCAIKLLSPFIQAACEGNQHVRAASNQ
jgi:hypothetical protein